MKQLNILGIETRFGYRTFELYEGDLSKLDRNVDVLVISAFANGYMPTPGTVIGALHKNCGLRINEMSYQPELDFRSTLGIWISNKIENQMFGRIICAELIGGQHKIEEVLNNVFVGLSILEAKGEDIQSVALPVLGAGFQLISASDTMKHILPAAREYLNRSLRTESILFVELTPNNAVSCSSAMDQLLGREKVTIPRDQLLISLTTEVSQKIQEANSLFGQENRLLRDDWLRLCATREVHIFELGVLARKLIELLVYRLGGTSSSPLYNRIRTLEEKGEIAPWICGYMNVLRHIGNAEAHSKTSSSRYPPFVEKGDLALSLFCVHRLLEFWIDYQPKETIRKSNNKRNLTIT